MSSSSSIAARGRELVAVSSYDVTSSSRTRLEVVSASDDMSIEAHLGVFHGQIWYRDDTTPAIQLCDVLDDAEDRSISTAMLVKEPSLQESIFAFVGFLKGVRQSFFAWRIQNGEQEALEFTVQSEVKAPFGRFGAAACVSIEPVKIHIACGLESKKANVWSMTQSSSTGWLLEHIYTVSSGSDLSSLAFDISGNRLVGICGETQCEELQVFNLVPNEKNFKAKFQSQTLNRAPLKQIFKDDGRLGEALVARHEASRNFKTRNDDLRKWEKIFPVGSARPAPVVVVVAAQRREDEDDDASSAFLTSSDTEEPTTRERERSFRKRQQQGGGGREAQRPSKRRANKVDVDEEEHVAVENRLRELSDKIEELSQVQSRTLGMMTRLQGEWRSMNATLERFLSTSSRKEALDAVPESPQVNLGSNFFTDIFPSPVAPATSESMTYGPISMSPMS